MSLVLVLTMLATLAACGGTDGETTTTATTLPETTAAPTTVAQTGTETTVTGTTGTATTVSGTDATTAPTATTAAPTADKSKTEVLALYKEILDKAKTTDKPGYKKYEYQEIPDNSNDRQVTGTGIAQVLNLAGNFITSKDKAMAAPGTTDKGGDMKGLPVTGNNTGSMLAPADIDFLKEAKYETLANGNIKITLVTTEETKPEPTPDNATAPVSKTGALFNPLSSASIQDTILNNGAVKALLQELTYDLVYHDCKSTLEYNATTKQIVSLEQIMIVKITANFKIPLLGAMNVMQQLYNTAKWYDFVY